MAIKLGEKSLARALLASLLQQEPSNEQALMWSAALADSPLEGIRILERILAINPNNQQAKATLSMMRLNAMSKGQGGEPETTPPVASRALVCPLCDWQDVGTPSRCAKCGAVFDVANLKALQSNESANEQLLLAGVQRWEQSERHTRTFDGQINLARAYLNLNRSNDAIAHLRRAIEIRPEEHRIRRTLEQLRARKLVLAVDDSMTVRRIVSIVLERNGYRVAVACDGEEALVRFREESPDLILLDVVMPGMNGYQVCRAVRAEERSGRIPVIILSSNLLDRIKGRLAGVTEYLAKPFEADHLLAQIRRYLPVQA